MKPSLEIDLRGPDGNVFSIVAKVRLVLFEAGMRNEAREFASLAVEQSSYDDVLSLCERYVDVVFVR